MQLAARPESDSRGRRVRWVTWPGAGAVIDDRVDVGDSGFLEGLIEGVHLLGHRVWIALIAPDLAVRNEVSGMADPLLHGLVVGGDPGGIVLRSGRRGRPVIGVDDGVEAGRAGQADDRVGLVELGLAVQVLGEDVEHGALNLGDRLGPLGEQRRQQFESRLLSPLDLDGMHLRRPKVPRCMPAHRSVSVPATRS